MMLADEASRIGIRIVSVITQPDQPVGRKQILTPSPVRTAAERLGIPVSFDLNDVQQSEAELVLLFAYGKIIPQRILDMPRYGFWNVHPSLLPKYRGASPIAFPLLLGDTETGVTLMQMDADLDHGPVIDSYRCAIDGSMRRADLETHLTKAAFGLVKSNLQRLLATGSIACQPQAHENATFTRLLEKRDGYIPFPFLTRALQGISDDRIVLPDRPDIISDYIRMNPSFDPIDGRSAAQVVFDMHRGLHGWPGLWTTVSNGGTERRLKLIELHRDEDILVLDQVQLEGKSVLDYGTYVQGHGPLA
jgi:methionyl-tRNA formyltransferase